MTPERWDVVVVGAGSSGCALAARLVDAGRRVLVLEAGPDTPRPDDVPAVLRDPTTLGAVVPGHWASWTHTAQLAEDVSAEVLRGRVVGGSSAVNAGYFVRGTPADFDGWAAAGNDLWSAAAVLPAFCRSEADADFGDRPGHGAAGPMSVARPRTAHPVPDAFAAACAELGFPAEPDKNAGGPAGHGPVPFTVADGVRVNTAMAYLAPRRGSGRLTVRGDTRVTRVVVEGGRAVGVGTAAGVVRADEVVLAAGAVGSPHLLLLSGIGPVDQLRAAGVPVVADVPGVGADYTDHPGVYLRWQPSRTLPMPRHLLPLATALNTADHLELMPWLKPFSVVLDPTAQPAADEGLPLAVALMQEDSRGRLTLVSPDPLRQPRLEHRYLTAGSDRRRLRAGVRLAADLLRTAAFAPLVAERTGLPDEVLADDRELDRWTRRHLTTAVHLAGTARMGPDGDAGAVVDQRLRVRGVAGLRVVDTSVMPQVTSRGPAATAVMIGERAAELF